MLLGRTVSAGAAELLVEARAQRAASVGPARATRPPLRLPLQSGVPWVNHVMEKGEKKMLCMDYNRRQGRSRGKNSKFLHKCCVAYANNQACGRNHSAGPRGAL